MELENRQISTSVAKNISSLLKGFSFPTPDRVLIVSPKGGYKTKSGVLIPSAVDQKELPRKGVVIQNNSELPLYVGTIVTYGMYAGKEIQLNHVIPKDVLSEDEYTFTVLSSSEIIYTESNIQSQYNEKDK